MKKSTFRQRLENEILVLDGVFGTLLQSHLPAGTCPDLANVERPDLVESIYRAYVDAGADIISTNTFGANRIKLNEFRLGHRTREINSAAVRLAKKAVKDRWIAGVIGPTGKLVEPLGPLGYDETYDLFLEQGLALAEGGVDLFLLETFSDLKEIKIVVMALREHTDLPIMASMTYGEDFLTFTGTDPVTAANMLISLGADAVGVNCSTGPEPMLEVLGRYAAFSDHSLFVEPNAGLPRMHGKSIVYHVTSEDMTGYAERFVQIGANIVGTCCGSTPEFTSRLRDRLKGLRPVSKRSNPALHLSSRVKTVSLGAGLPFGVIGERINPTNREDLAEPLRSGKIGTIQQEALKQVKEGAHLLDVNIGVPGTDEAVMMGKVIRGIENVVQHPLSIDSVSPKAIESALRESPGKMLINSVNGEEASLKSILPLVKRYGAGAICLAVGDQGIPKTAEERIEVLKHIVQKAEEIGIRRQDLVCDCLTLTVSAEQKRAEQTLKAVRMVKEELGLPTVLGVSNISYGLPDRSLINSAFLSMAMGAGLDAAIMNPGDSHMMETVRAASVLTVRDRDSKTFVDTYRKKKIEKEPKETKTFNWDKGREIYDAVVSGNREEIVHLVEEALRSDQNAQEINEHSLIPAIQEVGRRYELRELFLPQMIMAAETMQRAFDVLKPHFDSRESQPKGKVLICTVKGDVHDIGKNIVSLFLKNNGFEVIDLGKDIATETIVDEALKKNTHVVALSALMTTTMTEMPKVIAALRAAGSDAKVVVGGAVVTKRYANEIGADGFAKDGISAVKMIEQFVEKISV